MPKPRRPALQRAAIRGAWSTARLEAEIAARFGSRRSGGRKRRVPQDADGLLVQIEGTCEAWRRLLAEIDADAVEENPGHAILADLPDAVRRQVRAVGRNVAALQEVVTENVTPPPPRPARRPRRAAKSTAFPATGFRFL